MNFPAIHASTTSIEEAAEEYLLGRMSEADLLLYEEHLLWCESCFRAVEATGDFIALFREAASKRGSHGGLRVA